MQISTENEILLENPLHHGHGFGLSAVEEIVGLAAIDRMFERFVLRWKVSIQVDFVDISSSVLAVAITDAFDGVFKTILAFTSMLNERDRVDRTDLPDSWWA